MSAVSALMVTAAFVAAAAAVYRAFSPKAVMRRTKGETPVKNGDGSVKLVRDPATGVYRPER